jgi:glucose-6-phosphate 1-epimerase
MKQNLRDVVVWNPWQDKTPSFTDLAPDDYTHFVCVEAGSVGEPVVIPPGERVVCGQTLRIEKRAE